MELRLPVHELKSALSGLAKAMSRSSHLPVLQHVHVSRDTGGTVRLQATDLDASVSYQFICRQPGPAAAWLVPRKVLLQTAKDCEPSDDLALSHDKERLTFRYRLAGRPVDQPVTLLDLAEWPVMPTIDAPVELLDDAFKSAIAEAFDCCSRDTSRAALMGAWVDVTDPKSHYVMGTDGRHLYSANSFQLGLKDSLLLPHGRFLGWRGFHEDGPWRLSMQPGDKPGHNGWIQLRSARWTYITLRPDHTLPNWRNAVPATKETTIRFSERAAAFLVDALPKLPGKEDMHRPVRFEVRAGNLSVTGQDGAHATTLPVEDVVIEGPDIIIRVDRDFPLKALQWGLDVMELTDGESPLVFKDAGRRLVAMSLRNDTTPVTTQEEPMPRTTAPATKEPSAEPQPVNRLAAIPEQPTETRPTTRSVIEQIDGIRDTLKAAVRQFGDVVDALRHIEKDRKTTDKEVEVVREKLRAVQNVRF